jgi:signal transduction histidine kinase
MPHLGRLRLRTYLFFSLTLVAVGAIFFSGVSLVRKLGALQQENFARSVDFRARTLAHVIDTATQEKLKTLETLAAQIAIAGIESSPRQHKILERFRESHGFIGVTVTDTKGVALREHALAVVTTGRSSLTPVRVAQETNRASFRMLSPIVGDAGQVTGVVEAIVDALDYERAITGFLEQETDLRAVVLDREGRLIAQVNGTALEPMADLSRVKHYGSTERGEVIYFDGHDESGQLVSGARTRTRSDLGWTVVLARPQASILKDAYEAREDAIFRCVLLFCISVLVAAALARLISTPIEAIVERIHRIAAKDFSNAGIVSKRSVFQPAEISELVESSDVMSMELKNYTESLNRIVEDRTAELTMAAQHVQSLLSKSNELATNVSTLLDSMRQAVFSIDADRKIVAPFSKFTNELFRTSVEGQDINSVLFKDMSRTSEDFGKLDFSLAVVFGEDKCQWTIMEDELPKQIPFEGKTLKIDYRPLFGPNKTLTRIMFVVEDISEVLVLEKRVAIETRMARILQQIILHSRQDVEVFSQTVDRLMFELIKVVDMGADPTDAEFASIMRNLHTIKGNARLFGLEDLSAYVHGLESEIADLRSTKQPLLNSIMMGVAQIEELFEEFKKIAHNLFQLRHETLEDRFIPVLKAHYDRSLELLTRLKTAAGASDEEIRSTLEALQYIPIKQHLNKLQTLVGQLSTQLKKKVRFAVEGEDFNMHREDIERLMECIPHMIRNSMDHGIESAEDRAFYGKQQDGQLLIRLNADVSCRRIEVLDDGAGIPADKVVSIALSKGAITHEKVNGLSEQDKLALIFLPGLSTKTDVSDISGRGVGMDVVKHNVEGCGGTIIIESTPGKGTRFLMTFPPTPIGHAAAFGHKLKASA